MSSFLDTRKEFLSCVGHSNLDPDLRAALIQMAAGKPELLKKEFRGMAQISDEPIETQVKIYDFLIQLKIDKEERIKEEFEYEHESQTSRVAEKQPSYLDRPYDIVDKIELLLHWEKELKKCHLLYPRRIFIYNRRKCNKQCIIGFICVMFRNGIFKNVYNDKPGPDKTITFHDVLEYCQIRYHFGSLETSKKPLNICIQKALERIPGLKQFDDQNYQKNQTNLNIKKS